MKWGCEHESVALNAYKEHVKENHTSFEVDVSGLLVNPLAPHLGATADGFVSCTCCGLGVIEIKCSFSVRHTTPTNASFFENNNGEFRLSRRHNYYYQIQGQTVISERDFVCWTPNDLFIERIEYDDDMVSKMITTLETFYINVILPRVLCGLDSGENSVSDDIFCVCRRGESGKMIHCDSPQCEIGWYHYACLRLEQDFQPDEWFCPECEKTHEHLDY